MEKSVIEKVILTKEEIAERVAEMGKEIAADYAGENLLLVGILKGCVPFMADLMRAIDLPLTMDSVTVSSYGSGSTSGELRFLKDLDTDVQGKNLLLVDEILDSGKTLYFMRKLLLDRGAKSVKICAFLNKKIDRPYGIEADYVGFDCGNEFLVGYDLDYGEVYRNLPYVAILRLENDPS